MVNVTLIAVTMRCTITTHHFGAWHRVGRYSPTYLPVVQRTTLLRCNRVGGRQAPTSPMGGKTGEGQFSFSPNRLKAPLENPAVYNLYSILGNSIVKSWNLVVLEEPVR